MKTILRLSLGSLFAGIITMLLFLMMMALIWGEFKPAETQDNMVYAINPTVEDIITTERLTIITPLKKILPPPPAPFIERQPAQMPSVPIAVIDGAIPVFAIPNVGKQVFNISVSDREIQPLVRIGPIMPPRAETSGHCKLRFDVSPQGLPFNVRALYCTNTVFKAPAMKSVEKWKYQPKIQGGLPVSRTGVESKISFHLTDERGRLIPE